MRKTFRILLFFSAVLWVRSENLTCSVTQKDDLTIYTVSASKGTNCYYSWTNGTDHVLANEADKLDLVVNKDQTSLTTKKCLETVLYTKDCTSDDTQQRISCTFVCRGNGGDGGIHFHWGAVMALGFVVVVTITILSIIIISLRKKNGSRMNLAEEEEQLGASASSINI